MLFHSDEFLFVFLPVTLAVFYGLHVAARDSLRLVWLVASSLLFYGWWDWRYLPVIVVSIVANYGFSVWLAASKDKRVLAAGVVVNLAALAYFKYLWFVASNILPEAWLDGSWASIVLPLGISFFTFQQIAFLVDAYKGETAERRFVNYALFVCFFPQLIAGPIVHHRDIMPQFMRGRSTAIGWDPFALGLTILAVGLFKKVVIADGLAPFASALFDGAAQGIPLHFAEAWLAATVYGLQLYFDFSGYSDMAVGIAYMFGIRLPINFWSPYKACGVIEFWRRWHRTLSQFLRDYVYIPLGGNRHGAWRQHASLMATMLLGGLWHGAGWTFLVWGGLHGAYLMIEHGWSTLKRLTGLAKGLPRPAGVLLTFVAVTFAWVPFRAENFETARSMWGSMIALNGISLHPAIAGWFGFLRGAGVTFDGFHRGLVDLHALLLWCLAACLIVFAFPNVYHVVGWIPRKDRGMSVKPDPVIRWRPDLKWALATAILLFATLLHPNETSDFLYYQF